LKRRVPSSVPAKPNFAVAPQNPADQLRQDMQNAMHNHGQPGYDGNQAASRCTPARAPAAPQVLSDTQGVDFNNWLQRWHYITQQ
jgi:hypothetical protein